MITQRDIERIRLERDYHAMAHSRAHIMLGWMMIAGICAGGFFGLGYAIGKFVGMGVCR